LPTRSMYVFPFPPYVLQALLTSSSLIWWSEYYLVSSTQYKALHCIFHPSPVTSALISRNICRITQLFLQPIFLHQCDKPISHQCRKQRVKFQFLIFQSL
jgi:hypothetical protein